MRKFTALLLGLLFATLAFAKSVTMEQASLVANKYVSVGSTKAARSVANSFSKSYNGITTFYVFNYTGGGFVIVSADDAAIPVLAQSDEGFIEQDIANPALKFWLETYSREIADIVSKNLDNSQSKAHWDKILTSKAPLVDVTVGPYTKTVWDQNKYYNYYCPVATGAPGGFDGKAPVGCVATTLGQIMKYHNFPAKGVGSHSYSHGTFGTLSANFETNYNFLYMLNTPTSSNYLPIATLLYHAGVAVEMNYSASASGASNASVPLALCKYFNYDNKTINLAYKSDYSDAAWQALLISELNAKRPLYYSGYDPEGGHAWVCDGYQTIGADTKFRMNWGWSGFGNGFFAIGALNSGSGDFNINNAVVYGIKPGNPNLIVRFTDLDEYNLVPFGPAFDIKCSVVKGTPTAVNLYIDKQKVFNTIETNFTFPWDTRAAGIGEHDVRVEAINGNDTVYWEIKIGISEWNAKASGFGTPSRGIKYMHAVSKNLVWATASDGRSGGASIQEFTKTIDGGNTWSPGIINNCDGLEPAMVFAVSKDTAYAPMFKQSGTNLQGIYVTRNGGTTWTRQKSALFSDAASFPNVVHFFNKNDGFCMGDPINGDFEIYTTSNGGNTWTQVPAGDIADPVTGEFGVVSYYSAVGNNAWFGTNMGRVYRSTDKGLTWNVSATTLGNSIYTDVRFKDALNGLAQNKSNSSSKFSATTDGGITWTDVKTVGYVGTSDFCYVPGTDNTWVSAGIGASYSFDGGNSWATFPGTQTDQFLTVRFADKQTGWAGSYNTDATTKGIYMYSGMLDQSSVLNPVASLLATPDNNSVHLSWSEPATVPLSYTIYRNDTLLATNITSLQYTDSPVAEGSQDYCVTAVYALGQSPKACITTFITLNIQNTDEAAYRVYPNPTSEIIHVVSPLRFNEVRMINSLGKLVYRYTNKNSNLNILTEGFEPGMYILQIYTRKQVISKKVSIIR